MWPYISQGSIFDGNVALAARYRRAKGEWESWVVSFASRLLFFAPAM
jgi:hypothetical protein